MTYNVDHVCERCRKRGTPNRYCELCLPEAFAELTAENARLRAELIGELRSELSLANAYCANATADHCEQRLRELEAAETNRAARAAERRSDALRN